MTQTIAQRIGTGQYVHAVPAQKFGVVAKYRHRRGNTRGRNNAFGCRHRPLHDTRLEAGGRVAVEETRGFSLHAKSVSRIARDHDEVTFSGRLDFVGDDIKTARTGDFLMVPRNTRHAFRVDSETARFLNGYTPASLEACLVELAMPATERTLPPKGISPTIKLTPELLSRYGMDMLPGPDPLRSEQHSG